ncbi:MAG: hypothetical protein ACOCVF_02480 [bacterium]
MTIIFDKDKLFYTNLHDETEEISSSDLLMYLRATVEIKEGTTIDHFVNHLRENILGINAIFRQSLGNADFELFLEEYDKEPTEKLSWGEEGTWKLNHAEVYWISDYVPNGVIKYSNDDSGWFDLYAGFGGNGETYDNWFATGEKQWCECGLSFSFVSLNLLKDVELKLNNEIKILKYPFEKDENGEMIHLVNNVTHEMNLFTFLDSIFWEISWFGTPEDRDEAEKSLQDKMDQTKELINKGDYTQFTSIDDLMKELEDDDDEN